MQYDAKNPEDYLDVFDGNWRREKLQMLRTVIQRKATDLTAPTNYKLLSYGDNRGLIFHRNAPKDFVSLYVGNASKVDPDS